MYEMTQYLSNSLTKVFQPVIGQITKFTSKIGMVTIDTANSNLDGTGTLGTVFTATVVGGVDGYLVKRITIKAVDSTSKGMVRLFITGGLGGFLIEEIEIPEVDRASGITPAFSIVFDVNYYMTTSNILKASTQTGDDFVVIAEVQALSYN